MDIDIASLVAAIQASGMTQDEIGAEVGCSQSTISDIGKGKIGKIRPAYKIVEGLIALAKKQGVSVQARTTTRTGSNRRADEDRRDNEEQRKQERREKDRRK